MTNAYIEQLSELFDRAAVPKEIAELLDEWPNVDPQTVWLHSCRDHVRQLTADALRLGHAGRAGRADGDAAAGPALSMSGRTLCRAVGHAKRRSGIAGAVRRRHPRSRPCRHRSYPRRGPPGPVGVLG